MVESRAAKEIGAVLSSSTSTAMSMLWHVGRALKPKSSKRVSVPHQIYNLTLMSAHDCNRAKQIR